MSHKQAATRAHCGISAEMEQENMNLKAKKQGTEDTLQFFRREWESNIVSAT